MYHLTCISSLGSDTGQAATIGGITDQLATHLARHLATRETVRWTITTPTGDEYPGDITSPHPETAGTTAGLIDEIYTMLAYAAAKTADRAANER